jgi:hypothetical protein
MGKDKLGFVAFDSAKEKHAVAIADDGRDGEVRYLGEIDNSPDAVRKLVAKLSRQYEHLHFCYEAGPTGYGLHRQLTDLGHVCDVIAPTMIPKRSGDRVKTSRRDSVTLVKLLRAGELRAIWVPDTVREAVRDLTRAREVAPLPRGHRPEGARRLIELSQRPRQPEAHLLVWRNHWREEESVRRLNGSNPSNILSRAAPAPKQAWLLQK